MASKNLYNYEAENKKKKNKHLKEKKSKNKKRIKSSNQIDSDNEIIIGVTVYPDKKSKKSKIEKKKNNKKVQTKSKAETKVKNKNVQQITKTRNKKTQPKVKINKIEPKEVKPKTENKKIKTILRGTSFVILFGGVIVFALVSPIFNIANIKVTGNNKLQSEKIVGSTGLEIGQNIFKINKREIISNLENNGFIDSVKIKRNLPDEIEVIVSERVPSFAIEYGNGYVIIGNQGYIIEISDEQKELPLLIGTVTKKEEYIENNRLDEEDLNGLNVVLKIMNAASLSGIESLINAIDISSLSDVKIYLDTEGKVAYLGDCSNLSHRIQWVKTILEDRKGIDGEIMVNMNLNTKDPYFREKLQ